MKLFAVFIPTVFILNFALADVSADIKKLEASCNAGEGLACAKAAYLSRKSGDAASAYSFYQKGCDLKDESSCFNRDSISPKEIFVKKLQLLLNFHSESLRGCYIPSSKGKQSTIQYKEKWYSADFIMPFNEQGVLGEVTIDTNLSASFIDCSKKILRRLSYPKPDGGGGIRFTYKLTIAYYE